MMQRNLAVVVLLTALSPLLVGWNSVDDNKSGPANASESASVAPRSTSASEETAGVLAGRALFDGKIPPARKLVVDKDSDHCKPAAGEVQEVVVADDKALSGVVVEIQGIKQEGAWEWDHPEAGYVIRQKGCRFLPSFLVVPSGAELTVYNNDPVGHNVNTGQWNIQQPGEQDYVSKRKISFQGRSFIRVNCNIHSWMEGWIYVARSPYYTVTGADGKFKIENVPPGSYKVTARHPKLRVQRFKITVAAGQTVEQEVTFRSRSK